MEVEILKASPRLMHVGHLVVAGEPTYIVEVMEEGAGKESQYITVYGVAKGSNPPARDYIMKEITQGYKTTTTLGLLASKMFAPKKSLKREEKAPLFMTDIVYGVDTFTGKHSRGFYERARDTFQYSGGKTKVQFGEPTGVFISLESITWTKVVITPEDILREYESRKDLWYL